MKILDLIPPFCKRRPLFSSFLSAGFGENLPQNNVKTEAQTGREPHPAG